MLFFKVSREKWNPQGWGYLDTQAYTSPNCFIRFFIPWVEKLSQEGDKILKVEIGGGTSKFISWRLYLKSYQGRLEWQLEGANEQSYAIQVSNLLSPMVEGRQSDFFEWNVSTRLINNVDDKPWTKESNLGFLFLMRWNFQQNKV